MVARESGSNPVGSLFEMDAKNGEGYFWKTRWLMSDISQNRFFFVKSSGLIFTNKGEQIQYVHNY